MMKKLFYISICLSNIILRVNAQTIEECNITGKIAGLKNGEKILMTLMVPAPKKLIAIKFDSCLVKNGEFRLHGKVPNGPRLFFLNIDQHPDKFIVLLLDNENVRLEGKDIDSMARGNIRQFITVEGSETENAIFPLIYGITPIWIYNSMQFDVLMQDLPDSLTNDSKFKEGLTQSKKIYN